MNRLHFTLCLSLLACLLVTGCTASGDGQPVVIPTLMVLPSVTPLPVTDTPLPPTDTVSSPTDTPLPTDTITPTITREPTDTITPAPTIESIKVGTPLSTAPPSPSMRQNADGSLTLSDTVRPVRLDEIPVDQFIRIGQWLYSRTIDQFEDTQTLLLSVDADTAIQGWLSDQVPTLAFRCSAREFDILLHNNMQADVEYGLTDQGTIRYRIDEEESQTLIANLSTTGEAFFVPQPMPLLQAMLDHDVFLYGFTPINAVFDSTTFQITGLRDVIGPIAEACGLAIR